MIRLKKIYAMIPQELYDRLVERNIFQNDWDMWLAEAIEEKMDKEVVG